MRLETSISRIRREDWDGLDHGPSPFLRHGFLTALEESGSVGRGSGWLPLYLLIEDDQGLAAAVAAYVKSHSYGEYIFDWGWAGAAQRAGLPYYPKLVIAAPMTPATGPRVLIAPRVDRGWAMREIATAVRDAADRSGCHSIHWLFCTEREQRELAAVGFVARASMQFHWRNRGYRDFDDFLAALRSPKRKQIRKERARVAAAIERLEWRAGSDIDTSLLDDLDRHYRSNVERHGGADYLRPGFFHRVAETMRDELRIVEVAAGGGRVATALFFETSAALYGRYWGADRHIELLHFEAAYYAGIERCITRGTPLFEAGAQGEHKLLRGFLPSPTYSAHWFRHPGLAEAIAEYLPREAAAVAQEIADLTPLAPYR